jgi:hypothetical protein
MTKANISAQAKHFRVVKKGKYFRLMHLPSGDYIQRYLCDFLMHTDAIRCRNAVIAAVPEWDFADPSLFQEMPCAVFDKAWAAIYSTVKGPYGLRRAELGANLEPVDVGGNQ